MTEDEILDKIEEGFICKWLELDSCKPKDSTDGSNGEVGNANTAPGAVTPETPHSTPTDTPSTPNTPTDTASPAPDTLGTTTGTSPTATPTTTPTTTPVTTPTNPAPIPAKPPTTPSRKKFYEGNVNWKFVDESSSGNLDCWKGWDFVGVDGNVTPIDKVVSTRVLFPSSEARDAFPSDIPPKKWCATTSPQPPSVRTYSPAKTNIIQMVKDNVDQIIGLAGGIGLGLTEELVTRIIERGAKKAAEKVAGKLATEASEDAVLKAGKTLGKKFETKVLTKLQQKSLVQAESKLSTTARRQALNQLEDGLMKKLRGRAAKEVEEKIASEALSKLTKEMNQVALDKAGGVVIKSMSGKTTKLISSRISMKLLLTQQDLMARIAAVKLAKSQLDLSIVRSAKSIRTAFTAKVSAKIATDLKMIIKSTVTNTIRYALDSLTTAASLRAAKSILRSALNAVKSVLTAKVFFRAQAKMYLAIGKSLTGMSDNIAKLSLKLTGLGSKLAADAMRLGFRGSLKTALKFAKSMRPGPMAIFDMVSMAMDLADVGGFQGFMSTDDYNKEVANSNDSFKATVIAELKKSEPYKDQPNFESSLLYPIVLDPTTELPDNNTKDIITKKVDMLFEMAKVYDPHPCIKGFLDKINSDLAAGVLAVDNMSDNSVMDPYMALIDLDSVVNIVDTERCATAGGQQWLDEGGNKRCTYTKSKCMAKYSWPMKQTPEATSSGDNDTNDQIYTSWQAERCVIGNPEIRTMCEKMGATWNADSDSCNMDRQWCLTKGGEFNSTTGNCKVPLTQKAVEAIFGTSVTRLTKQLGNMTVRPAVDLFTVLLDPMSVDGTTVTSYQGSIRSGVDNQKCLDVGNGGNIVFPSKVQLYDCNGTDPQQFEWSPVSQYIRAAKTTSNGKSVCLENPYGRGGAVWAVECNGEAQQKWVVDNDEKTIRSAVDTDNYYMDHNYASTSNGTLIGQRTKNGQWTSFTFDTKKTIDPMLLGKKIASSAMTVVFAGSPVGAQLVDTGFSLASTMMNVVSTMQNVAIGFAEIYSTRCNK
jgi:hypothetical protein